MGKEVTDIINLGLLPFVLYMAWLFWVALQKSNDRYASLLTDLIQVIKANTQAFEQSEDRAEKLCENLIRHEAHVSDIEDKIDVMAATLHNVDIRTIRMDKGNVERK